MNQRVTELAQAATTDILGVPVLDQKLFAKLIVKECIDQVEVFDVRMDARPRHIVEAIKQHFGIDHE